MCSKGESIMGESEVFRDEVLSWYSDEILNWLDGMNDDQKVTFLLGFREYTEIKLSENIIFDKLQAGDYMPELLSTKKKILKRMKSFIISDSIFSLVSGFILANISSKDFSELLSKYSSEPAKQSLLSLGYVSPISLTFACTFFIFFYLWHHYLCCKTISDYQKLLDNHKQYSLKK